jgi:Activator of Hsp90 ATPase homolog 1-like protein
MQVGSIYKARVQAKDGSFGFDFKAIYTEIIGGKEFTYEFDGRKITVQFDNVGNQTEVAVTFDAENENPIEIQQNGWQIILNNFKAYTEQ